MALPRRLDKNIEPLSSRESDTSTSLGAGEAGSAAGDAVQQPVLLLRCHVAVEERGASMVLPVIGIAIMLAIVIAAFDVGFEDAISNSPTATEGRKGRDTNASRRHVRGAPAVGDREPGNR
jgi:hypothetical protein